jgi:hypothetical protein
LVCGCPAAVVWCSRKTLGLWLLESMTSQHVSKPHWMCVCDCSVQGCQSVCGGATPFRTTPPFVPAMLPHPHLWQSILPTYVSCSQPPVSVVASPPELNSCSSHCMCLPCPLNPLLPPRVCLWHPHLCVACGTRSLLALVCFSLCCVYCILSTLHIVWCAYAMLDWHFTCEQRVALSGVPCPGDRVCVGDLMQVWPCL